jgi:hypothetical protein
MSKNAIHILTDSALLLRSVLTVDCILNPCGTRIIIIIKRTIGLYSHQLTALSKLDVLSLSILGTI